MAKKKKVKGYRLGGGIGEYSKITADDENIEHTGSAIPSRNPITGAMEVVDAFTKINTLGLVDRAKKKKPTTKIGGLADKFANVAAPMNQAIAGAGLNALAPGTGTALNAGVNATKSEMNKGKATDAETGEKFKVGKGGLADAMNSAYYNNAAAARNHLATDAMGNEFIPEEFSFATQGLNKGGSIKGKGTGTSDSIDAHFDEDDFVISKKVSESPLGKGLMEHLGTDDKTVPLHKGKVKVNVSNGETLVVAEDRPKADAYLVANGVKEGLEGLVLNEKGKLNHLRHGGSVEKDDDEKDEGDKYLLPKRDNPFEREENLKKNKEKMIGEFLESLKVKNIIGKDNIEKANKAVEDFRNSGGLEIERFVNKIKDAIGRENIAGVSQSIEDFRNVFNEDYVKPTKELAKEVVKAENPSISNSEANKLVEDANKGGLAGLTKSMKAPTNPPAIEPSKETDYTNKRRHSLGSPAADALLDKFYNEDLSIKEIEDIEKKIRAAYGDDLIETNKNTPLSNFYFSVEKKKAEIVGKYKEEKNKKDSAQGKLEKTQMGSNLQKAADLSKKKYEDALQNIDKHTPEKLAALKAVKDNYEGYNKRFKSKMDFREPIEAREIYEKAFKTNVAKEGVKGAEKSKDIVTTTPATDKAPPALGSLPGSSFTPPADPNSPIPTAPPANVLGASVKNTVMTGGTASTPVVGGTPSGGVGGVTQPKSYVAPAKVGGVAGATAATPVTSNNSPFVSGDYTDPFGDPNVNWSYDINKKKWIGSDNSTKKMFDANANQSLKLQDIYDKSGGGGTNWDNYLKANTSSTTAATPVTSNNTITPPVTVVPPVAAAVTPPSTPTESTFQKMGGIAGAVGIGQTALGLANTLGKAPAPYKIDPNFSQLARDARMGARSGMSPEELSMAQRDNELAYRASRAQGEQYGQSAAGRLYNDRESANSFAGRGLDIAAKSEQLRRNKELYAADLMMKEQGLKQGVANDAFNRFSQTQQAGAALASAGIKNYVTSLREKENQRAAKERALIESGLYTA